MMGSRSKKNYTPVSKVSIAIAATCAIAFSDAFLITHVQEVSLNELSHFTSSTKICSSTANIGKAPVLKSLLKKPSKVLTVGVEYSPKESDDLGEDRKEGSLEILSMKLRNQAKVSFIACSDLATIKLLSEEQYTAKGDFPGPVPIICNNILSPPSISMGDLSDAGASAVVIDVGASESISIAESAVSAGLETVWKVSTREEAEQVLKWTNESADIFLLDVHCDNSGDASMLYRLIEALPQSSTSIATVKEPMQKDGAEIEMGKEFKSMGCASIYVEKACVGDKEDIDYSSFLVSGLTSKASKEFKFSGLTGSTNGHFGGIQSNSSVKWERTKVRSERRDEDDKADLKDE